MSSSSNAGVAANFKFTSGNEKVEADIGTLSGNDAILDGSAADADVMNVTLGATSGAFTANRIETINVNFAAGTPDLQMTGVTGTNKIAVTGSVAGAIEELDASIKQPTISLENYGRVLTVNTEQLSGTTTLGTAETLNISVSGATYGTTAATRTGVTLTADTGAGTLETLNIVSSGTTANAFALDASTNVTLNAINLSGTAGVTLRVTHDDITGVTVNGASAADDAVRIDRQTYGTTATNAANFTGVSNLIVADDATTAAAALVLASVQSGQKITVVDDMATGSSITVQGAATSTPAASLTLVLDNETANTDLDITDLDIQNVTALALESSGYATTSTDGTAENALKLVGDFTSVTLTGDTTVDMQLAIDGAGSTGLTARTVVVNASGMTGTARAELDVESDSTTAALVSYNLTGTANGDDLNLSTVSAASSITGGAGNDTIVGGGANDVISGGEGNDSITTSAGTDTIALGDGTDTIVLTANAAVTAAVQEVQTITFATDGASNAAQGYVFRILGEDITVSTINADTSPTTAEFEARLTVAINESAVGRAGRVSAVDGTGVVVTFAADEGDVAAITVRKLGQAASSGAASASLADNGVVTVVQTSTGSLGDVVDAVVSDFTASDLINYSTNLTLSAGGYYEGAIASATQATEYGIMVITDQSYASIDAAEAAINTRLTDASNDDQIVVFLNSTTGIAQAFYDSDMDTDGAATTNSIATFTGITTLTQLAAAFSATQFI